MNFWNGNKTPARQHYELNVLKAVLRATDPKYGPRAIEEHRINYPDANDEANIFSTGTDILVTVEGNPKFVDRDKIVIKEPLAKGLLGQRLLIIKEEHREAFAKINSIEAMRRMVTGIPGTWADADLFRANDFPVVERGFFEEVFTRLKNEEFDYVALGAVEVEAAFETMAKPLGGLMIEPNLMIRYPLPLVFYVNPERPQVAERVREGLQLTRENGWLDELFTKQFGETIQRLNLGQRRVFDLINPMLEESRAHGPAT